MGIQSATEFWNELKKIQHISSRISGGLSNRDIDEVNSKLVKNGLQPLDKHLTEFYSNGMASTGWVKVFRDYTLIEYKLATMVDRYDSFIESVSKRLRTGGEIYTQYEGYDADNLPKWFPLAANTKGDQIVYDFERGYILNLKIKDAEVVVLYEHIYEMYDAVVDSYGDTYNGETGKTLAEIIKRRRKTSLSGDTGYPALLEHCKRRFDQIDPAYQQFMSYNGGTPKTTKSFFKGEREIETTHFRGYRFFTPEEATRPNAVGGRLTPSGQVRDRYTKWPKSWHAIAETKVGDLLVIDYGATRKQPLYTVKSDGVYVQLADSFSEWITDASARDITLEQNDFSLESSGGNMIKVTLRSVGEFWRTFIDVNRKRGIDLRKGIARGLGKRQLDAIQSDLVSNNLPKMTDELMEFIASGMANGALESIDGVPFIKDEFQFMQFREDFVSDVILSYYDELEDREVDNGDDVDEAWFSPNWFPIAENYSGDLLCYVNAGIGKGTIVAYWHDWERRDVVYNNLTEMLEDVLNSNDPKVTEVKEFAKALQGASSEQPESAIATKVVAATKERFGEIDPALQVICETGLNTPTESASLFQTIFRSNKPPKAARFRGYRFFTPTELLQFTPMVDQLTSADNDRRIKKQKQWPAKEWQAIAISASQNTALVIDYSVKGRPILISVSFDTPEKGTYSYVADSLYSWLTKYSDDDITSESAGQKDQLISQLSYECAALESTYGEMVGNYSQEGVGELFNSLMGSAKSLFNKVVDNFRDAPNLSMRKGEIVNLANSRTYGQFVDDSLPVPTDMRMDIVSTVAFIDEHLKNMAKMDKETTTPLRRDFENIVRGKITSDDGVSSFPTLLDYDKFISGLNRTFGGDNNGSKTYGELINSHKEWGEIAGLFESLFKDYKSVNIDQVSKDVRIVLDLTDAVIEKYKADQLTSEQIRAYTKVTRNMAREVEAFSLLGYRAHQQRALIERCLEKLVKSEPQ